MKWKLVGQSWFRKVCLWAWWEITCFMVLGAVTVLALAVGYMTNWFAFAGIAVIATIAWVWHLGWLTQNTRKCILATLVGCVMAPLTIGAGYGIGTHKAEEWSKSVTYKFFTEKEKEEKVDEKKPEKEKEPKPGSKEYFDRQFAKLNEKIDRASEDAKKARSVANEAKKGTDEIARRLKIDLRSEDEPLDFPVIVKPELKIAPESSPSPPLEEEPQPIKRNPEPKAPGKFKRSEPDSPGKAPKIPSITKVAKIVGSKCSFGKKHPAEQFCMGADGRLRFVDEARDRCTDGNGTWCTCVLWIREGDPEE